MDCPERSNAGIVVYRLEMIFDRKRYVHGQHFQLLTMKEKYDTSKDIDTYMYLAHDVIYTPMPEKRESNILDNCQLRLCSKRANNLMMDQYLEI